MHKLELCHLILIMKLEKLLLKQSGVVEGSFCFCKRCFPTSYMIRTLLSCISTAQILLRRVSLSHRYIWLEWLETRSTHTVLKIACKFLNNHMQAMQLHTHSILAAYINISTWCDSLNSSGTQQYKVCYQKSS